MNVLRKVRACSDDIGDIVREPSVQSVGIFCEMHEVHLRHLVTKQSIDSKNGFDLTMLNPLIKSSRLPVFK